MAAPQIPNLNSLRGAGGRGRGGGRGDHGSGPNAQEGKAASDKIVQQTDQDASFSRLSAVQTGYLDDPFAKYFVSGEAQKRYPIINRGTYVRTKAIDGLVDNFLADKDHPSQKKQLISLGAGSDTRFFRLMSRSPKPSLVYHELDFPENTAQKVAVYKRSPDLCELIGSSPALWPQTDSDICFDGDHYHLHPIDLRTLDPSHAVDFRALDPPRIHSPKFADIDPSLPTLLISECCLIYLDPTTADNAVKYFTQHLFSPRTMLGLIIYEPIRPQDPFGQMMVSNLRERGIVLQTLRKYGSLEAQAARMKAYGFQGSGGADVKQLWQNGVDEKEKERVAKLEMVDEVEEWELLAAHYCVVWGWRGEEGIWEGWKKMAK